MDFDSLELKLAALMGEVLPVPQPPVQMVGRVVGDTYEIVRELGAGGMGQVFAARHVRTQGEVAVKLIRPKHGDNEDFLARFELEAKNTAALNHPNIVKVFDYGHDDGVAFIAMELVAGAPLTALIESAGVLATADAIEICAHTLRALQVAHEAGLVHRDIKPDNIVAVHNGDSWFVKVLDFGIAYAVQSDQVGPQTIVGSPHSMAPEQFDADGTIGPRSDLYAVGCTMFAMLTGRPPFHGTFWELAVFHAERSPPTLAGVPEPLSDWVHWLLSKSPEDRPVSAQVALEALLEVEHGHSASPIVASHLPSIGTTFFGRDEELALLDQKRLAGARLVTLVGTGGLGKTRLSIEWGRRNARRFPEGSYFCDLAEARTVDDISIAVAQTLDAALGDGDPVDLVGRILAGRGAPLVILDNFEQVVEHANATVAIWREAAPDVSFLVTSRHRLSLDDEHVVEVSPLATAHADDEGVKLFVDRAVKVRHDFAPSTETREVIRQLVEQLDGLPFPIEMAAARARVMSPEQILERLGQRFRLLRSTRQDITERQLTMRATLEWSWDLLEPVEQAALRQCAAFAGSFDLNAAEAVLDLSGFDDPWIADVLESLVDKSLLRTLDGARFGMFVSVHEFTAEKLSESLDENAARERHLNHYAWYGTEEAIILGETSARAVEQQARELENLRAAMRFGSTLKPGDELARVTSALLDHAHWHGPVHATVEVAERVIDLLPHDSEDTAQLSSSTGVLLVRTGQHARATAHAERGLAIAERLGDERLVGLSSLRMGFIHLHLGRLAEAQPHVQRGVELVGHPDSDFRARALSELLVGIQFAHTADVVAAKRHLESALELSLLAGNKRGEGWIRRTLAIIYRDTANIDAMFEHAHESLALARETGGTLSEAWALSVLGEGLTFRGDYAAAIAHFEAALKLAYECGEDNLLRFCQLRRANIARELGHPSARAWTAEVFATADSGHLHHQIQSTVTMASALRGDDPQGAFELLDKADAMATNAPPSYITYVRATRASIEADMEPSRDLLEVFDSALGSPAVSPQTKAALELERTRLLLSLGEKDAALESISNEHVPWETLSADVQLSSLCRRAQVLSAHGLDDEAAELAAQADRMSESMALYPDARLSELVRRTREALERA